MNTTKTKTNKTNIFFYKRNEKHTKTNQHKTTKKNKKTTLYIYICIYKKTKMKTKQTTYTK